MMLGGRHLPGVEFISFIWSSGGGGMQRPELFWELMERSSGGGGRTLEGKEESRTWPKGAAHLCSDGSPWASAVLGSILGDFSSLRFS